MNQANMRPENPICDQGQGGNFVTKAVLAKCSGFILALLFAFLSAPLVAAPIRVGAVTVDLVAPATSIQPGKPFLVGLKMVHQPHWHSYWINPGTGLATGLTWTLPAGFTAGEIQWPTPHVMRDTTGKISGYGYEGDNLLLVEITPPATLPTGGTVTLQADVEWLMCQDQCMPGNAKVELTLPVKAATPAAAPATAPLFAAAQSRLPGKLTEWEATATAAGSKLTLRLVPHQAGAALPKELHFFDRDAVLDMTVEQTMRQEAGAVLVDLTLPADTKTPPARLIGLLAAADWGPDHTYGSRQLDVAVTSATAATPVVAPTTPTKTGGATPGTSAAAAAPAAATSLPLTLALAFIGGLILNLMPCVFPVLAIKILGFVNQSGHDKRKIVQHGLVFAAGVLVSFWTLAGILLVLRAGGSQLGWGFQLQSPAFVFGMAAFLLVFALNLSGLFEFGLSATGAGASLQMKDGLGGSFFTGALATLVATPCSAPFLAPALGAALTLSPIESLAVFTAIAVGLATPYLLLSLFPSAIKLLPRPGAWMETFKQFMAFPLYATVGWLLWVLAGQTSGDDNALLLILFGMVLVALAAWFYGRFGQSYGKPGRQRFGQIAAVLVFAAGIWTGWPKSAPEKIAGAYEVTWEKWSPAAIASAQAAGKYVYVDFTARWCATCQTNKATVFHNDAILAELARRNVVLLRGDWTNKDPAITAELARWGRSAVPFDLIYAPGKPDPVQLPELLTPTIVLDGFAQAAR